MKKTALMAMALAAFTFYAPSAFAEPSQDGPHRGDHKGKMFEADTNGDGMISKSEFKAHHEQKIDEWFSKLDQDGNGEVTPEEARAGREKMREHMKERAENRQEMREERHETIKEQRSEDSAE